MVKASDNVYPRILVSEGGSTATPASGNVTIYAKADGLLYQKDDAGAETLLASGASGAVATDAIWDAAGDLAVGTGANTAARLAPGTAVQALMGGPNPFWGPGAWATTWTPTLTASSVNPTLGTGSSVSGVFCQIGKLVIARFIINFGSSGVAAGTGIYSVSLPVTALAGGGNILGVAALYDSTANQINQAPIKRATTTTISFVNAGVAGSPDVTDAVPWTWAASDNLSGTIVYDAA